MKISELTGALEGVPELLRSAAAEIREGRTARTKLEKTAAVARVKATFSDSSSTDEDILSELPREAIEKLADRLAPRSTLGEASEEASSPDRTTSDVDFLENLRTLQ